MTALEFLQRWSPSGHWVLTMIPVDGGGLVTRTFSTQSAQEAQNFIQQYNGKGNLYFSVNQPIRPLSKKAERSDIDRVEWLHVDTDPRPGKSIEEEQVRALTKLTSQRPEGVPSPTCIVFSGGGYQAFWRLKTPIEIGGNLDKAEEIKLYNMQLERIFSGDNCHNIDRIMRLPGTMNVPNAKKVKLGRVPALATVFEFNDSAYELHDFVKASTVQSNHIDTGSAPKLEFSGNIPKISDINELDKWKVPNRVKIIVVQGIHPDAEEQAKKKEQGDNSRSAWLFDAVCSMVRCGVPNDVIYALLTDSHYGISDSVLELGTNAERYAKRQIERALSFVEDPDLQALNDKYAFVKRYGNKARILHEYFDEGTNRYDLAITDVGSFRASYNNRVKMIPGEDGKILQRRLGDWWLTHPKRKTYDRVAFIPGVEAKPEIYNLWKGFACQAIPGDCSLFLDHLQENVCQKDDECYGYLLGWMARLIQQPNTPGEVAVVMRGGMGVGKGIVANTLGSLLGRHFMPISDPKHIVGNFNAHLRSCLLLFADEAFYAGDKKHESNLKTLITEPYRAIEGKGVDVEIAANYLHVIMASNNDWVVPSGTHERRFFVLDVGNSQQQNSAYFGSIQHQLDHGGREALLYFLLKCDIRNFDVRKIPQTQALQDQKDYTLGTLESWWLEKLESGEMQSGDGGWPTLVTKQEVYLDYLKACDDVRTTWGRLNKYVFGRQLRKLCPGIVDTSVRERHQVLACYKLPTLAEARTEWDRMRGSRIWSAPAYTQVLDDDADNHVPF